MTEVLDADQALLRWRDLEGMLFAIRGQDIFFCEARSSCCSAPLTRHGKAPHDYEVCADCGRGCVAHPKGASTPPPTRVITSLRENLMIEHTRLGRAIQGRPQKMTAREWLQHRVAWAAVLEGQYGKFRGVANAGRAFWPGAPIPWTEDRVRGMVDRSREIVRARLWPRRGGDRVRRWRRAWREENAAPDVGLAAES